MPVSARRALVALVAHVLRAHDWGAARSVLYRKRRGDAAVHAEPNDGSRPWRISRAPHTALRAEWPTLVNVATVPSSLSTTSW